MFNIRKYFKGEIMEELEKCSCCCGKRNVIGLCSAIAGACLVFVGHVLMLKKCEK